jgi:hypothetical protein
MRIPIDAIAGRGFVMYARRRSEATIEGYREPLTRRFDPPAAR